jgi:histidyl-tRNA synthetase
MEHSLGKQQGLNKLYYVSPMFRQERPQAGRYRQFHQFGAEALGSHDPSLDAEMIILAFQIISSLGLKNLEVKINSLGVPASREKYKEILREYIKPHFDKLTEDSRKRFDTNILRIFDSKAENDQEIMKDAPLLIDHLDEESLQHFEVVKKILDSADIKYEVDPKLVRGLDYYTHTTFEIISGSVGAQSALCGGGRYDLLVEQCGGDPTPGVGFAAGIERILLACENENSLNLEDDKIDLYIVRIDKELTKEAYELSVKFRKENINVELDYLSRSVKAQMREANKLNAKFVLLIGGEEYTQKKLVLKNMETSEQTVYDLSDLNSIKEKITK